ncbi:MAG: GGDEF domain-containing protein [Bacillota bacterium]
MQAATSLLVASLGAIAVLMMLYVYIFIFERKLFFSLWFIGWAIIALNYSLDAFFPDLLRQDRSILLLSLGSYFYANLLVACGTLMFLKLKSKMLLSAGGLWTALFLFFSYKHLPNLYLIQYTHLAVFVISFRVGAAMIGSAKRYGIFAGFLGLLNIAWGVNTIVFPYIVSQIIPLISAIGLIQLFFKEQKDEISSGLEHITYLTFHDQLTGLYNKAYFDKTLKALEHDDARLPVSVLIGDMNGLKFVNDVFGHQEGDQWLKRMALIIAQSCRQNDIAARWGGDEFAIILPNTDKGWLSLLGATSRTPVKMIGKKISLSAFPWV